jgi:hypothetical protein
MTLDLIVRADVVDIRTDTPCKSDIFLVDTNVWLWYSYPNSTTDLDPARQKDVSNYLSYLIQAASVGATLAYSGLILVELASVIERNELKTFQKAFPRIKPKEYRHNFSQERANVAKIVESAWAMVRDFAISIDLMINDTAIDNALQRFQEQSLDGYDLLHLETMIQADAGQIKIMTDDCDYCTIPEIQLFTSNSNVIEASGSQHRLRIRT